MKITEHLNQATKPLFSYEIIPPPRGRSCKDITDVVEQLKPFDPPFIDVTSHCSQVHYKKQQDGSSKKYVSKKRPGSIGLSGVIKNRYGIDTVVHILCRGFSKEETEDALIELNYLGAQNVLALRGDEVNYDKHIDENKSANTYACDLVKQIDDLRQGKFIEEIEAPEPMEFCIGVAGYPETHVESPDPDMDIKHLKSKVEAGADYLVTQMFFNNDHFYRFVEKCRAAGITIPIIPGIKILNHERHLTSIPRFFNIEMPEELAERISKNPENAKEIGIDWGRKQVQDLLRNDVPCIHFYIMNDASSVINIIS